MAAQALVLMALTMDTHIGCVLYTYCRSPCDFHSLRVCSQPPPPHGSLRGKEMVCETRGPLSEKAFSSDVRGYLVIPDGAPATGPLKFSSSSCWGYLPQLVGKSCPPVRGVLAPQWGPALLFCLTWSAPPPSEMGEGHTEPGCVGIQRWALHRA